MKVLHSWLQDYIGEQTPTASEIEKILTFHAFEIESVEEVEGDMVIDVDVLPNRSSDCLCHRGIAREIATLLNIELVVDPLLEVPTLKETDSITIDIENKEACPRFTASHISGVKVGPSPEWLQKRLRTLGQRPINNIVDATNYVMLALGQPLHAYDATKFPKKDGVWQFSVRSAQEGETIDLLAEGGKDEDRKVTLSGGETLIVDGSEGTPIGLAGVKGGVFAGVDESTTEVIIEAAHFDPNLTRKTTRKHGIVIEASKRFENECVRELPLYAQVSIVQLIADIAGGVHEGTVDQYLVKKENQPIAVRPQRVNSLLGLSLEKEEMTSLIKRTGSLVENSGDEFNVKGPFERTDLVIEEDIIEEIGRIYGYEHVKSVLPDSVALAEINKKFYYSEAIRDVLLQLGFSEVITSSFRKKDAIKLQNALASDKAHLRSSLIKNISEVLDRNVNHKALLGVDGVRVFEIGTVFKRNETGISEEVVLGIGVRIKPDGYSGKEDVFLTQAKEALSSELKVPIDWQEEKGVAQTSLTALLAELPEPTAYQPVIKATDVEYRPFSTYPSVSRDIALWIATDTQVMEVADVLQKEGGELLVRTDLFDEFTKDGRTSLAYRLVFQATDRTLTDQEVNEIMERVYAMVEEKGWEVR